LYSSVVFIKLHFLRRFPNDPVWHSSLISFLPIASIRVSRCPEVGVHPIKGKKTSLQL
ncbi:hypothetical protein HAX54_019808, partial [Datura stramonium]|nr:hypothetical protein [Datura stramonium]